MERFALKMPAAMTDPKIHYNVIYSGRENLKSTKLTLLFYEHIVKQNNKNRKRNELSITHSKILQTETLHKNLIYIISIMSSVLWVLYFVQPTFCEVQSSHGPHTPPFSDSPSTMLLNNTLCLTISSNSWFLLFFLLSRSRFFPSSFKMFSFVIL